MEQKYVFFVSVMTYEQGLIFCCFIIIFLKANAFPTQLIMHVSMSDSNHLLPGGINCFLVGSFLLKRKSYVKYVIFGKKNSYLYKIKTHL